MELVLQEVVSNQMWVLGTSAGVILNPEAMGFVSTDSIIPAQETLGKRENNEGMNKINKEQTTTTQTWYTCMTENITASP